MDACLVVFSRPWREKVARSGRMRVAAQAGALPQPPRFHRRGVQRIFGLGGSISLPASVPHGYPELMMLPSRNAFAFAAGVVQAIALNLRGLALAFALPALVLLVIPLLVSFAHQSRYPSLYLDYAAALSVQTVVPLIALVSVVRFFVLGEEPPLDPRRIQWRAVVLVTLLGLPFWLVLRLLTDFGTATQLYFGSVSFTELPPDFGRFRAAFMIYSFVMHSLGFALVYPLLGPIAVWKNLGVSAAWKLFRNSLPAILLVSALLIAASWMAFAILQTAAAYLFLAITTAFQGLSIDGNWQRGVLISVLGLPNNFIFAIVPAVAVAQLTLGLRSHKATSASSASPAPR